MEVSSDIIRIVLKAAEDGELYWTRKGGSHVLERYRSEVKECIRMGYLTVQPMDCCRKDYLITFRGEQFLRDQ